MFLFIAWQMAVVAFWEELLGLKPCDKLPVKSAEILHFMPIHRQKSQLTRQQKKAK